MNIIAALTQNYVIGNEGKLPWPRLKGDLPIFKQKTAGKTVVMGRLTYESMGSKPLPNRENIVVSRTMPETQGIIVVRSLEDAIAAATREVWFIGGERIFTEALIFARELHLSWVKQEYEGDAYFPRFEEQEWTKAKITEYEEFTLTEYTRRPRGGRD
ncbi:dihydrofolate reductase [Candidatus Woesearchaeota archaeon]|nr:dihydrofolate reductase [Candidatus Woesearchaeota archaeon]